MNETTSTKDSNAPKASMRKRFINYVLSKVTGTKASVQTASFDTLTGHATFASDLFFKPDELKRW